MSERRTEAGQSLKAILICPDAALADQFLASAQTLPNLAIVVQVDHYPSPIELAEKVRQIRCDAVLVDVGSDRQRALELIAAVTGGGTHVSTVGLNRTNDPEAILQWLRSGGTEFFSNPFSPPELAQAVERMLLRRTVDVHTKSNAPQGQQYAFAPAKGGAGATTIAINVACQFHKTGKGRVLLADFNLFAGVISFLLRSSHPYNATDALKHSGQLDAALWGSLVVDRGGMDILLAPERPEPAVIEPHRVQQVLEYARSRYDHVIVDLGSIFEPVSMATLPVTHVIHLVCGSDLPSLFMMRRTIPLVEELGYGRQMRVLVNRVERRAEITTADMEKIFRAPVHTSFPEDSQGVAQALRDGVPLPDNSNLGKSIGKYAAGLLSGGETSLRSSGVKALKELFSGT